MLPLAVDRSFSDGNICYVLPDFCTLCFHVIEWMGRRRDNSHVSSSTAVGGIGGEACILFLSQIYWIRLLRLRVLEAAFVGLGVLLFPSKPWVLKWLIFQSLIPFHSNRQHLSSGACLIRGKIIRTALCCVVYDSCAQWYAHTREQFLQFRMLGLDFFLCVSLGFVFCVIFHVSLGRFVLVGPITCFLGRLLGRILWVDLICPSVSPSIHTSVCPFVVGPSDHNKFLRFQWNL